MYFIGVPNKSAQMYSCFMI